MPTSNPRGRHEFSNRSAVNYSEHYARLIARARFRTPAGYKERHHVLPKCMGGGNEPGNLVELTGEEHYVAHQLLVKMYPGVSGLARAAALMSGRCGGNKVYGWLRRRYSKILAEHMQGRKASAGTRAKISAAKIGNTYRRGKTTPPEVRAKISASLTGKIRSLTAKQNQSEAMRGFKFGPRPKETRAKISAAKKGKPGHPLSQEHIQKMQAGRIVGIKLGPRPQEVKDKISASKKGKKRPPFSDVWCANISAALQALRVAQR